MIDLHCHLLPGIDDGADTLKTAVDMARIALDDGIRVLACTPHIYPGLYHNDSQGIRAARDRLQAELRARGMPLELVIGADVHLVPGLVAGIRADAIPTLNGSRYLLLEPSHHVRPPGLEDVIFDLQVAGYVPIITHPERLRWIEEHYSVFGRLAANGVWMQLTAGSLTGAFGPRARYWSERFLEDGLVHLLATDAHSTGRRRPVLSEGLEFAKTRVGEVEARRMVEERPAAVLRNASPSDIPSPPGVSGREERRPKVSIWQRWMGPLWRDRHRSE